MVYNAWIVVMLPEYVNVLVPALVDAGFEVSRMQSGMVEKEQNNACAIISLNLETDSLEDFHIDSAQDMYDHLAKLCRTQRVRYYFIIVMEGGDFDSAWGLGNMRLPQRKAVETPALTPPQENPQANPPPASIWDTYASIKDPEGHIG